MSSFVRLIATTPDLQSYSVRKLYAYLKEDLSQEGLSLAGSWVIGEFGDALLRAGHYDEDDTQLHVSESDIVDLFINMLDSSYANQIITEYIVTAAMKLTTRLTNPSQIERLRRLLQSRQADLDVETQQRAVEYVNLFGYDQIRRGVLEKMPAPEIREEQRVLGEATKKRQPKSAIKKPSELSEQDMLLELMGGSEVPAADLSSTMNGTQNNTDLLADILGDGSSANAAAATSSTINPSSTSNSKDILDLFNDSSSSNKPTQTSSSTNMAGAGLLGNLAAGSSSLPDTRSTAHEAYKKNDFQLQFQIQRTPNAILVLSTVRNTSISGRITNISLQTAVPKSQKLQLQPMSSSDLGGGEEANQQMRITAVTGVGCLRF